MYCAVSCVSSANAAGASKLARAHRIHVQFAGTSLKVGENPADVSTVILQSRPGYHSQSVPENSVF